jgi:hypothetical protein
MPIVIKGLPGPVPATAPDKREATRFKDARTKIIPTGKGSKTVPSRTGRIKETTRKGKRVDQVLLLRTEYTSVPMAKLIAAGLVPADFCPFIEGNKAAYIEACVEYARLNPKVKKAAPAANRYADEERMEAAMACIGRDTR